MPQTLECTTVLIAESCQMLYTVWSGPFSGEQQRLREQVSGVRVEEVEARGGDQGESVAVATRDGRADGAGGERRAREARRVRGRFCRRPRPAVPAAARLISHLAAPGPVCAEPGIPPAAQPAPAPSSPPPRSSRRPAEPGRIPGAGAHNWPRLDGAP